MMLPMVCSNWPVFTMMLGVLQVRPKSWVTDSSVGPVSTTVPVGPPSSRSHTEYAVPACTGSAGIEVFLLKKWMLVSFISTLGGGPGRPPSPGTTAGAGVGGGVGADRKNVSGT